jgi:hypothetical protein
MVIDGVCRSSGIMISRIKPKLAREKSASVPVLPP